MYVSLLLKNFNLLVGNIRNSLKIESQDESGVVLKVCHEWCDELRLGEVGVLDGRQRDEAPRGDQNAGWGDDGISKNIQYCNFPNFERMAT